MNRTAFEHRPEALGLRLEVMALVQGERQVLPIAGLAIRGGVRVASQAARRVRDRARSASRRWSGHYDRPR